MPKQGKEKVAFKKLLVYLNENNSHNKRYIKSVMWEYMAGLKEIEKIKNRNTRITLRMLFRNYYLEKLEIHCKHKLSEFHYMNLENTIKTFFREYERPDQFNVVKHTGA